MELRVESPSSPEVEHIVRQIIGCAIEVHRELGPGFLENIYRCAMRLELEAARLPFECEKAVNVRYRDWEIPGQRLDLVVGGAVVVELKAVRELERIHEAQVMSYLKATGLRVGLLINFNRTTLREGLRRLVR
jgi:GxxExxY protein